MCVYVCVFCVSVCVCVEGVVFLHACGNEHVCIQASPMKSTVVDDDDDDDVCACACVCVCVCVCACVFVCEGCVFACVWQ